MSPMWQLLTWQKQALAVTALAILLAWGADALFYWLYGERAPLTVLTTQRPADGEGGAGWHADETDRFGLLARRLWGRLLDAEVSVQV